MKHVGKLAKMCDAKPHMVKETLKLVHEFCKAL